MMDPNIHRTIDPIFRVEAGRLVAARARPKP